MNLPNYFLADLPPEAQVTAQLLTEACQTLKHNREHYLLARSTQSMIETLAQTARLWQLENYPLRQQVLAQGPALLGFPASMLARGLDAFFSQLTVENLSALIIQEFGHAQRLDHLVASITERAAQRAALVRGPEFLVQITAGQVPIPTLMSLVLGVLLRSAQLIQCARGTTLVPRLFAHSLHEMDPKLGACLEIVEWPGGSTELESILFNEADCVTVTGSDETLASIRQRMPAHTRWIGYGPRVSFGYITHRILASAEGAQVVQDAAEDIVMWNQLGCLSPHLFYVEHGRRHAAEQFAEHLARELARREEQEPRGPVPAEIAAAIATRRSFYEVRAAHSLETRFWASPNSTAWTVVYEVEPRFQLSCWHRFVYVKPVTELTEALHGADAVRHQVSTVGLAATDDQAKDLATALARWGAPRICPLGQMQNPPLAWRHDGRPALADLVTWTDWEQF